MLEIKITRLKNDTYNTKTKKNNYINNHKVHTLLISNAKETKVKNK